MTGRLAVAMLTCLHTRIALAACDPQAPVGAACTQ